LRYFGHIQSVLKNSEVTKRGISLTFASFPTKPQNNVCRRYVNYLFIKVN
jgi:hypothetical protein